MEYEFDIETKPSHIRALNDTASIPPYIPVTSPSAKRKRDVLLYISPISANTSFNSSTTPNTSFGSDGSCDGCENGTVEFRQSECGGGGCQNRKAAKNGSTGTPGKTSPAESEVPSPRTRVANKLEGLNLSAESTKDEAKEPSKSAKVIKAWRKTGVGKFTSLPEQNAVTSNTKPTDATKSTDEEEDPELASTPRKKRAVFLDTEPEKELNDPNVTPKKRKGKGRAFFKEPMEVETTASEAYSTKVDTVLANSAPENEITSAGLSDPVTFVGSLGQSPGRRKLRSPPPVLAEGNEQRPADEADTDSDPDETGIGYRPTAQQRELRSQKRMQQIKEYKARESREARAKRTTERRRRNVTERIASATSSTSSLVPQVPAEESDEMADVQRSGPSKRVHFAL